MTSKLLRITEPPTLLREQAFVRLRDAIISGHFVPGERLIERELCEAMGVSRTSIREVLRRLEAERLIEVSPRRGPTVARVTRKQALEIYELRAELEATLVRRFTERANDREVAELRRIFEEIATATAKKEDLRVLLSLIMRFNDHIIQVVDHEVIGEVLKHLTARISFLRVKAMAQPGRLQDSLVELGNMIGAIERRDGKAATRHARTYVANACAAALDRLEGEHVPVRARNRGTA